MVGLDSLPDDLLLRIFILSSDNTGISFPSAVFVLPRVCRKFNRQLPSVLVLPCYVFLPTCATMQSRRRRHMSIGSAAAHGVFNDNTSCKACCA